MSTTRSCAGFPRAAQGASWTREPGRGPWAALWSNGGYTVVACDLDPSRFRAAGVPCVRADLAAPLPFASQAFDAVVSTEVVEHLEDPHRLIRECARILRPGGTLVLSTPNILSVYSRLHFLLLGTFDFFDTLSGSRETAYFGTKGHINPVGFPELRYALVSSGFRILDVTMNRSLRVALRETVGLARLARPALGIVAATARLATRLLRWRDPVSRELLSPALLYGESLILRGQRLPREDTPA